MPTVLEKIRVLGENGKYDICASTSSSRSDHAPKLFGNAPDWVGNTIAAGVCHSYTPDGRCVSLFKVLFTNKCLYNCKYCFNNVCKQRMEFTPEEYARTFMKLYSMNVLEGLFLSSGVCGDADETTKKMLETVRLLRYQYRFQGYVHFKCLPGTSAYLLKEAIALSDRISVNVEAPTKQFLAEIAEQKDYNNDILTRQQWIKSLRLAHNRQVMKIHKDLQEDRRILLPKALYTDEGVKIPPMAPQGSKSGWVDADGFERRSTGYNKIRWDGAPILNGGQTTQMVLGAGGETDWDIMRRLDWEYREINLRRGYFSAFSPIKGTPFEKRQATPLAREHRLYQTDWLMRLYDFQLKDIKNILTDTDNLPRGDPKVHLAHQYFESHSAVDPNVAPREELLKVPGIGQISARRIVDLRKQTPITSRTQLHAMGVVLKRADPFLVVNGRRQKTLDEAVKTL